MKLSATRIKRYLTCPRQFRYAYIDQIPAVPTGALAFGRVIHLVLQHLHERTLMGEEACLESAAAEFKKLWQEVLDQERPYFKDEATEISDYRKAARSILNYYFNSGDHEAKPLVLEYSFELPWGDGEHTLAGIIDRIDEVAGGLVLIDYKTGKKKPGDQELDEDLQFTIYAYAAEQILGVPISELHYHHLRRGLVLVTQRSEDQFQKLLSETLPQVTQAIEAKCFEPSYGYWCRFCDFRELCQAEGPAGDGFLQTAEALKAIAATI